jgi:photosystem II stability/assembly factor-like uncharacterized protein
MAQRVYVAVGTKKGAFLMESGPVRDTWEVRGPYMAGQSVMHLAFDERTGTLLAAAADFWFGARVYRSKDFGHTWDEPVNGPRFAEDSGEKVEKVWQVVPGRADEPGVIYAGAEPASIFKSSDSGETWTHIESLNRHPTTSTWNPSAGGLCLHSITLDPTDLNKLYLAISAGGLYATEDGGATWEPRNKGVRADFFGNPPNYPESGQCVHHAGMHPAMPQRLYQQNHCGVYRSDDAGRNWTEISDGLPSDWGLAMAIHPHNPDSIYVCQAISQMEHFPQDGRFSIYRTNDAGSNWERLYEGLPQQDAFLNVHREGLAVDKEDPCGVYIGANTGQLWASRDEGASWTQAPAMFPPISSVTAFSV